MGNTGRPDDGDFFHPYTRIDGCKYRLDFKNEMPNLAILVVCGIDQFTLSALDSISSPSPLSTGLAHKLLFELRSFFLLLL
jgi:hypothetical protein